MKQGEEYSDPYIQKGEFDYWINTKRPPNYKKYGRQYEGYPNWSRMALFQDFCVGGYDVEVNYKGKTYYFLEDSSGVQQCETPFDDPFGPIYTCGNDFLDNYRFPDGKSIPEVIDELEVELW